LIDLSQQVAVVTGGAGEIGTAISVLLAELGAETYVVDVNAERGAEVERRVREAGGTAHFVKADATSHSALVGLTADVIATHGRIDIAVGGVGWTAAHAFVDEGPEYWQKIVDLNLMSSVFLTHAVLPGMVERTSGRIVLVSSLAGRIGRRERALYSASKAGIIGFARAVALEHARDDITINCVAPGATDTEQMRSKGDKHTAFALENIPRGRLATPEDQAQAVAFLASAAAGHITGQVLAVDGGATMV
jgi:2-hydroxycyclohexanecarboxyl-CoA dehydrogenase